MAKTKVSEFDATASNNTDINSVNVAEGCPPSGINNAIREMASLLKKQEVGTDAMTSPDINGGTIDGATIGGSSGVTIGVSDGTVSAPSIKFTSDTNTGIYRGGTDILKFVTAGTDAITIDASQDVTLAGSLNFADNEKAIFGAGSDLQIYHDATDSRIEQNGTGRLLIRNTTDDQDIVLQSDNGSGGMTSYVYCDGSEGVVRLYRYGAEKLATTNTGIDVTGTATMDGLTVETTTGTVATFYDDDNGVIKIGNNTAVTGNTASLHLNHNSLDGVRITSEAKESFADAGSRTADLAISTRHNGNLYKRMDIASNGDISFYEDTGTTPKLFWDSSAECLNVGTTTSEGKFNVNVSAPADYPFRLTNTSSTGYGLLVTAGDGSNALAKFRDYAGNDRVYISGAGNLLVGKTTTALATAGITLGSTGFGSFTRSGFEPLNLNRLSSDGNIAVFYKDGTTVGNIGSYLGSGVSQFYISGADTGFKINSTVDVIAPSDGSGSNRDNAINLGDSSNRWKDLYLSGGVYLGGTGSANHLDDYEEGTWTPAISTTTGSITINSSFSGGSYTKIGDTVIAWAKIRPLSQSSPTGGLDITGLPFTAQSGGGTASGGFGQGIVQGSYSSDPNIVLAQVYTGTTDIRLRRRNGATSTDDMATYLVDGNYYTFTVIYKI